MEIFELYLSSINNQEFKAIITESSVGEGETESSLPFFENGSDWRMTLLRVLGMNAFNSKYFQEASEQDWMVNAGILDKDRNAFDANYLINIGQALYRALFPSSSKVEKSLQAAIRLAENKNTQLHIRLKFEADVVKRSRLVDYPWELLHDGQQFLLHHQVTISRYIAYDALPPCLPAVERVIVLFVSSAAFDSELGLKKLSQQEKQAIRQGLDTARKAGRIHLVELNCGTISELRKYLTEHRANDAPHVLHFDGHGLLGKRCANPQCCAMHKGIKAQQCRVCNQKLPDAQGYLVFENSVGEPDYVSAEELGTLLHQSSLSDGTHQSGGIALCVLSACQSAMVVEGDSIFNGTAQNLINHRVPAVLAMQYSVSVTAATQFVEQFYRSLGQKNSLAYTVSQGREVMGVEGNQWYRPVLYLRWRDNEGGQLFVISSQTTAEVNILKETSPSLKSGLVGLVERIRQPVFSSSGFRSLLLVSLTITFGLVVLRFLGLMEWLELKTFDHLMQVRPLNKGADPRLLIVEITDKDIEAQNKRQEQGQGSALTDASLNRLLETLEKYKPRLVGLDVYRPYSANSNLSGLLKRLGKPNVFAVCKVPEIDKQGNHIKNTSVAPPKEVASRRIGFSDFVIDRDRTVRRYLMAQEQVSGSQCQAKQSFSLLLAHRYLELQLGRNIDYQDPFKSEDNLQLGGIIFPQLQPFTGGYQDVDASGFQVLLNYRATVSGPEEIATKKTLEDILSNRFKEQDIRDKIVLIGGTTIQGINDSWSTPYGTMPGVIVHGHMISQILSAVLDEVPLLQVWPQPIEILWIWGWSLTGGVFALYSRSLRDLGIATACGILVLYVTCIICLTVASIWIPLIPSVLALVSTGGRMYFVFLKRNHTVRPAKKL